MAKKFNNKRLTLILLILIGVFVGNHFFQKSKGDRTFKKDLITIDSADIVSIRLFPKVELGQYLDFTFDQGKWWVTKENIKAPADKNSVNNIFNLINELKPKRLAATSIDKWKEYEVTDSLGTRLIFYGAKKEILSDFVLGKVAFSQRPATNQYQQQPQMQGTSFVRLTEDDRIYAVDGFMGFSINQNFTSWRLKRLAEIEKSSDITSVTFENTNGSGFKLTRPDSVWMINGVLIDEKKVQNYLNQIYQATGNKFADNINLEGVVPQKAIQIEGNNFSPVRINAFLIDSVYYLNSTFNPLSNFMDDNLMEKVFKEQDFFLVLSNES